jgi:hypothetical protein
VLFVVSADGFKVRKKSAQQGENQSVIPNNVAPGEQQLPA